MKELLLSEAALSTLVYGAVFLTLLTPVILLALLLKDWKEGELW